MTRFFTLLICLLVSCTAFAAPEKVGPKGGNSLFDRWSASETLSIELYINMDSLEVYRKIDAFIPAKVIANGQPMELEVAVRGRFRRRTCAMPPLKLKFAKDGLRANGLNTHNDFKLVTHCSDDEAGREALLREQLAYELYSTVNPEASFRTQLLEVTYVNTVDGSRNKSIAIIIEDFDELQERLNLDNCKDCYGSTAEQVINAEEVTLFQYMIGNTDFCNKMIRNVKLLAGNDGEITAVPYDFDFSGLVNANYALPQEGLGQTSVKDRVLKWSFEDDADYSDAIELFQDKEATLLAQVENFEGLENASKREITKYLKAFFKDVEKGKFKVAK